MIRNLFLLLAILATLVVLGCWDNRRQMERVLKEGYAVTAEITGAQFQRRAPFAFDGWRPRLVEEALSVDLKWQGRDGKPHEYKKVPVSENFERTIVNGEQVRLMPVPAKVLDDESAVPVITTDATARLASLQAWLTIAGYIALAAWAGFAATTLLAARRGGQGADKAAATVNVPPRRLLLGLAGLLIGGFLAFHAWSEGRSVDAIAVGGVDTPAEIIGVSTIAGKNGGAPSHAVQLGWKDAQGGVHHFGRSRSARRSGRRSRATVSSRSADHDPLHAPTIPRRGR
jgi:hypothetical protein